MLASLSLLLTGCLITPGKFASELILSDDQEFAFSYDGEIFFLALSDLGPRPTGSQTTPFEASPCYVDGTGEERTCTRNEIEGQRQEWARESENEAEQARMQAEQMAAMLGGIDPTDPQAGEKIAALLMRQKGYESVVSKGKGVFEVKYRIAGKLTHDFMFPVMEGIPTTNPFVQILLRDGDIARINAPGYAAINEGNPVPAMFGGVGTLAGLSMLNEEQGGNTEGMPALPMPDGRFTIVLTPAMQIRANNTDEGAVETARGQELTWMINSATTAAPTALIALNP
ncbi:MAG: hypothetical protein V2I27_03035 [Erythrobacter sp.]|nr:hypothetical protein [Erythrobacter sp.]